VFFSLGEKDSVRAALAASSKLAFPHQRCPPRRMALDVVSIANRGSGKVLAQQRDGAAEALDNNVSDPTHRWYRIPVGEGLYAYKNVATGNVLEQIYAREGLGNVVANGVELGLPRQQWKEIHADEIFVALSNRNSGWVLDHYYERDVRAFTTNPLHPHHQWCLIWHRHDGSNASEVVTFRNFRSHKLLEHDGRIQAVGDSVSSDKYLWRRLPVGRDGLFAFENIASQKLLSDGERGVEATSDDAGSAGSLWCQCEVRSGFVALQNVSTGRVLDLSDERSRHTRGSKIFGDYDLWKVARNLAPLQPARRDEPTVDDPSWSISPAAVFREHKPFARGGFGTVYRATWSDVDVVQKEINGQSEQALSQLRREVKLWSTLRHRNVVPFYGANLGEPPFFVILSFASNGTLPQYLTQERSVGHTVVWKKLFQVAAGLRYLHGRGIIHGDLKGDNILVDESGTAMLTDFGLSFLDADSAPDIQGLGAMQWRAPEYATGTITSPSFESDVYSLGMCIIEAVSAWYPWGNLPDAAVRWHLRQGDVQVPRPEGMTDDQWRLVNQMIAVQRDSRPQMTEVMEALRRFADAEATAEGVPLQFGLGRGVRERVRSAVSSFASWSWS
jgi:hypothetical protein